MTLLPPPIVSKRQQLEILSYQPLLTSSRVESKRRAIGDVTRPSTEMHTVPSIKSFRADRKRGTALHHLFTVALGFKSVTLHGNIQFKLLK